MVESMATTGVILFLRETPEQLHGLEKSTKASTDKAVHPFKDVLPSVKPREC